MLIFTHYASTGPRFIFASQGLRSTPLFLLGCVSRILLYSLTELSILALPSGSTTLWKRLIFLVTDLPRVDYWKWYHRIVLLNQSRSPWEHRITDICILHLQWFWWLVTYMTYIKRIKIIRDVTDKIQRMTVTHG